MAATVVKDKVIVGNSGGELGVRGWILALDVESGEEVWRAYNTGPDSEVLIGPDFKPFYSKDQGEDLGAQSWPGEQWRLGGSTVWGCVSYDSESNLIYYGTGNPGAAFIPLSRRPACWLHRESTARVQHGRSRRSDADHEPHREPAYGR